MKQSAARTNVEREKPQPNTHQPVRLRVYYIVVFFRRFHGRKHRQHGIGGACDWW